MKLLAWGCALAFLLATAPAEDAAGVVTEGWRHRVWAVYPPEKYKAQEALPTSRKLAVIEVDAARGEYEPFVIVLRPEVPMRDVKVEVSDLRAADGAVIPASEVEVRRVAYIHVDEPSGTRMKQAMPFNVDTGDIPDPLPKGDGAVRPGHNLQFWVTLHVPRATKPGAYSGEVKVIFRKEGWMPADLVAVDKIPLSLRVRTFALPEQTPLLNAAFFDVGTLGNRVQDKAWLRGLYRSFAEHKQVAQPTLPSPKITVAKNGDIAVDSTEWEQEAEFCLNELHTSHLFIPVRSIGNKTPMLQGFDFLWHYPAVTKQRWFGPLIAAPDRSLTPEFQKQFGVYLRHMHEVLSRRGWLERAFVTTMDEPYTYHLAGPERSEDTPANNYEVMRNLVKFIRAEAPGLKTYSTADPVPELDGVIDHWCLRNLNRAPETRDAATKKGQIITVCDNYRTFIDYPCVAPRTLGWLTWKLGARGWLTYETVGFLDTAWEGPVFTYPIFGGATTWGMGQLFYPTPGSPDLIPSIRWEMMREGADDYEYLWLLRQTLESASAMARQSEAGKKAKALLATAALQVVGGSGDPETLSAAAQPNTQSNLAVHRLRFEIAEAIENLSREGAAAPGR